MLWHSAKCCSMLFVPLHAISCCGMLYATLSCPVVSCFVICSAGTACSHVFAHVAPCLPVLLWHAPVCHPLPLLSEVIKCHPMLLQE